MSSTALRVATGRTARPGDPRSSAWIHRRDRRGLWFVVPFLVAFLLFMIAPLGYAIYTSLYTSRIIGGTVFTGAGNYTETLQSGEFWNGVERVIIYAVIQIPVMLAIAFFFATIDSTTAPSDSRCTALDFAIGLYEPPCRDDDCADGSPVFRTVPCTRAAPPTPPGPASRSGARDANVAFAVT